MHILSVKKKKGNTTNCKVEVVSDSGEICELAFAMDVVLSFNIFAGKIFTDEEFARAISKQREMDVKQTAYKYAAYKPRTTQQIISVLKLRKYSPEEINIAVDFLRQFCLLDDAKYAESYIKDAVKLKNASKQKIYNSLLQKGIDANLANFLVEQYYPEDTMSVLLKVAEKKLVTLQRKPPEKRKQSLFNFLLSKGFSPRDIIAVFDVLDV